jgi:hypothetical protein
LIYENIDWTRNDRVCDGKYTNVLTPLLTKSEQ